MFDDDWLSSQSRRCKDDKSLLTDIYLPVSLPPKVGKHVHLPEDLLYDIFMTYRKMMGGLKHYKLFWVRVTHVCRHWRQVSLRSEGLWDNIQFTTRLYKSVEPFLERSKYVLLDVIISLDHGEPTSPQRSALDLIRNQLCRVRSLTITIAKATQVAFIGPLLRFPAPHLKHLEVVNKTGSCSLPRTFFANCDALISFSAKGFVIPWNASFQPKRLQIFKLFPFYSIIHDIPKLLNWFSECTEIEELHVVSNGHDNRTISSSTLISLRPCLHKLRFLRLSVSSSICSILLSHVQIPNDIEWEIRCGQHSVRDTMPRIIENLPYSTGATIMQVILNKDSLAFRFQEDRQGEPLLNSFQAKWTDSVPVQEIFGWISLLFNPNSQAKIEDLTFELGSTRGSIDRTLWSILLSSFPFLRVLTFRNMICCPPGLASMKEFIVALSQPSNESYLFDLTILELNGLCPCSGTNFIRKTMKFLQMRQDQGLRVQKLTIAQLPHMDEPKSLCVEELREFVDALLLPEPSLLSKAGSDDGHGDS